MKKITLLSAFFMISLCINAQEVQDYEQLIAEGTHTVDYIIEVAEQHFDKVGRGKGTGYTQFKRWEYRAKRTQDENGMLKPAQFYYDELERYNAYINQKSTGRRSANSNWEDLGPTYWNQTSGWNPGVGRLTSVVIDPSDANHIIVGAIQGGVWKTTDGGSNWTVLTDNLSNLRVYSLAMDPTNSSTYYWGANGGAIFKSTDTGATWSAIGSIGGRVNKILIDPTNTSKMYASSRYSGVYKSTDGGASWAKIHASSVDGYDVEFKPGDVNTIYATGDRYFRSTDGGSTFSMISSSFGSGAKMMGISADDASVVYVLEENGSLYGGLYKSTDSGATFTKFDHGSDNYFGYSSLADDNRGQAPRDMDIVVNPTDVDDVHIAGILSWRSTDGGSNFNITSQWVPSTAASQNIGYCHADIDIMIYQDGKLYIGSDGGIFVANNPLSVSDTYYTDLSAGLGIRQFYRIGISQTDPVVVSGGSQDNGTSVYRADGNWYDWLGADGMETFVDKDDTQILYGTSQYGSLYKSTNGGSSYFGLSEPGGKSGNWVTPFEQDPVTSNVIYAGYDEIYKSTNGGSSWTSISQNFGSNVDELKIAPSNNQIMYMADSSNLWKTTDGGATNWTQLSGTSGTINWIAIHPSDPNKVAVATSGSAKVYVTENGGSTWTSLLYDLPNFTAYTVIWDTTYSEDVLYVGMNYGIYYLRHSQGETSWQPFSNNLPNAEVSEFEINTAENKIYAATYARGLWRSDLYKPTLSIDDFAYSDLSLFPNPANDIVNIKWNSSEDVSIRLYNTLGKLMYYKKGVNLQNGLAIDASSFNSGLYFVKISSNQGEITKKLILE